MELGVQEIHAKVIKDQECFLLPQDIDLLNFSFSEVIISKFKKLAEQFTCDSEKRDSLLREIKVIKPYFERRLLNKELFSEDPLEIEKDYIMLAILDHYLGKNEISELLHGTMAYLLEVMKGTKVLRSGYLDRSVVPLRNMQIYVVS